MNVFLKTIFTSEHEIPFIAAQIIELDSLLDRVIIIEPQFTHTGYERKLIGIDKLLSMIPKLSSKIDYIPLFLESYSVSKSRNDAHSHFNENITRGAFIDHFNLSINDIVISTDSDEVLYQSSVSKSLDRISSRFICFKAETLRLNQFMLSDSLIAPDFHFYGPSIIGAGRYLFKNSYAHWRYAGKKVNEVSGCHFSWCLPYAELLKKVQNFAHSFEYGSRDLTAKELLDKSLKEKTYYLRTPSIKLMDAINPEKYWPDGYIQIKKIISSG
ncbi:glycosyltransferase family 17 domain protein [SAR86 cluster bacterium SAR86E]|uniref:Glycosyltransferase family 17 domain protein n=1 Tax=SAR86 cluster bacterium SAR86E TaxID=1208365 RepID=K6GGI7_9GAMM|nr:glycosyltransferase family 17 domain protein [SAR86 cluster bacterium SAR86E]